MAELFDPQAAKAVLKEVTKSERDTAGAIGLRKHKAALKGSAGDPKSLDLRIKSDFRVFLTLVWRWLGLPDPTPLQLSIAWWLQHGPERAVIMAFRGCAKSWITAAFALWTLYCDPQKKVLVVSASLSRAVKFVQFCLALVREMPELRHLAPKPDQRQSGQEFDVAPARPDQSPSLKAAGITGQITGSRADLIVPDDIEIPSNSMTTVMRDKIKEAVKEFDSIIKPGGAIKFLGTPQVDDSLYSELGRRGYAIRIWTARFPTREEVKKYGDTLSPFITKALGEDPRLVGSSVEPTRFSDDDLSKRERSLGKSTFRLQFMLDTSLADADRYPLKLRDLIVMSLDPVRGPESVAWSNDDKNRLGGLPCLGHDGDGYFGPANVGEHFAKWTRIVGALDTSGRGLDETSLAIVAELNGLVFLLYSGAWRDGYSEATLSAISQALVRFNVGECHVESNFGDGMFLNLLQPYVTKAWNEANGKRPSDQRGGTELVEETSGKAQKELRILSVLEPATQGHRLVVNSEVIEADWNSVRRMDAEETRHRYSLAYQFSHLTRDRDSLVHDDRLEAVAIAISRFAETLGMDPIGMASRSKEEREEEEIEKLFADAEDLGVSVAARARETNRVAAAAPRSR